MATRRVGTVIGSLRKDSFNRRLASALRHLLPASLELHEIAIGDLPLFSQDLEADVPAPVQHLKREIESCQALLFVTPEYNRSIPGVLKNALDWGSRPYGNNSWGGKPAAMVGISPGQFGTALAQQHLRSILGYLDVATLGQPEMYLQWKEGMIDEKGQITNDSTRKLLQKFVDRYVAWVDQHVK